MKPKLYGGDYWSFDDSGTISVHNIINKSTYDEIADFSSAKFESYPGYRLAFAGDISSRFHSEDRVDLTVHILQVTYHTVIETRTWTMILETFKKEWNTLDNSPILSPPEIFHQNRITKNPGPPPLCVL